MQLPIVLCYALTIFIIQLSLCFSNKNEWIKILPLSLCAVYETLCWAVFFVGKLIRMEDTLSFPAFILSWIGLYWVFAPIAAILVYAIVKFAQKRIK